MGRCIIRGNPKSSDIGDFLARGYSFAVFGKAFVLEEQRFLRRFHSRQSDFFQYALYRFSTTVRVVVRLCVQRTVEKSLHHMRSVNVLCGRSVNVLCGKVKIAYEQHNLTFNILKIRLILFMSIVELTLAVIMITFDFIKGKHMTIVQTLRAIIILTLV